MVISTLQAFNQSPVTNTFPYFNLTEISVIQVCMIISFLFCLTVFLLIGLLSVRVKKDSRADYYLCESKVAPWLVGLSAMATNNSGYMFIGLIGYTYTVGLSSVWLMVGWILGDLMVSLLIHKPLREQTEQQNQLSYAGVLAHWGGTNYRHVQLFAALLIIFLLLTYASAQMIAGSKALLAIFGWPIATGAIISAIMIAMYCFAGGIRASIWTDAAQATVMMIAMAIMVWIGITDQGGVVNTLTELKTIDHNFLAWFPKNNFIPGVAGAFLFALGWMFGGASIIGQPHIMIRFMALDNISNFTRARIWYYSWYAFFYFMGTCVGLLARLLLPDIGSYDAELALPMIAMNLLPPVIVGLVLAGLFAATMSTADSLILSTSAAITQDLTKEGMQKLPYLKVTTLIVTFLALLVALTGDQSVFNLVIFAWSGLGASFAPLLIIYALGKRPSQTTALVMMLTGLLIVIIWRQLGWHIHIYEGMPGILGGILVFVMSMVLNRYKTS
jgi:sodium/proline symporter